MPDALLLDWEDSIVETSTMRRVALQRALHDEGLVLDSDDCARCCDGASVHASMQRALATLGVHDLVLADLLAIRASRAFAERLGKGFLLRTGAREFIGNVQVTSRLAIVTLASRSETEFILRLAGFDGTVSTIVSADDALDPPPMAAPFATALAQLSRRREARAERSIAISTPAEMIRSARAAGLRSIALGAPAHVALEAHGAVDTLDGLSVAALSRVAGISAAEHTA
ncbi:hypothetical protein BH09GEM1_BH09GEM1_15920 [soil metagenome]